MKPARMAAKSGFPMRPTILPAATNTVTTADPPIIGELISAVESLKEYRAVWLAIVELESGINRIAKDGWQFKAMSLYCEGGLQDGYQVVFERAVA